MKSGLDHPTLAKMKCSFTCKQAITEQRLRSLKGTSFDELFVICDQKVADEIRMVQKVRGLWAHAEIRDVAELCKTRQKLGRLASEGSKVTADPIGFRRGWKLG